MANTMQAMVEKAFTPDVTLTRLAGRTVYAVDKMEHYRLKQQVCQDAGIHVITDETIDAFMGAAGSLGLTVEVIDHNQQKEI